MMSIPIYFHDSTKGKSADISLIDGYAAGCIVEEQGDRVILTLPNGLQGSMARDGLKHFNVTVGDQNLIIGQYEGAEAKAYCCVTCNNSGGSVTACGESACCPLDGGYSLCC